MCSWASHLFLLSFNFLPVKRDAILSVCLCISDPVKEVSLLGMRPVLDKWEKGLTLVLLEA